MEATDTSPVPDVPAIEDEKKKRKPWYRRILYRGFGTATLYLKKPVLPPLVEYQNLLVRRNPLDNVVDNEQQQRGVDAYLQERNRNTYSRTPYPDRTGAEVKLLRRFRFLEDEENLRPCPVDIGVGGRIALDPIVKIEPLVRIRVADLATIKFLPEPVVKLSKRLPFHYQGMQAHLRYEVPVTALKNSWWKPPARMLIRFEHGSNSGFHLYPGGLEFGDHTVPLTADNSIALRVAAGLTFPREYPMRPDHGPKWEMYRLGIKTVW